MSFKSRASCWKQWIGWREFQSAITYSCDASQPRNKNIHSNIFRDGSTCLTTCHRLIIKIFGSDYFWIFYLANWTCHKVANSLNVVFWQKKQMIWYEDYLVPCGIAAAEIIMWFVCYFTIIADFLLWGTQVLYRLYVGYKGDAIDSHWLACYRIRMNHESVFPCIASTEGSQPKRFHKPEWIVSPSTTLKAWIP